MASERWGKVGTIPTKVGDNSSNQRLIPILFSGMGEDGKALVFTERRSIRLLLYNGRRWLRRLVR